MRALLQRVTTATVTIDKENVATINRGLLIFVCAMQDDTPENAQKLAVKISKLRIFQDSTGKMNRALIDIGGQALIVSQFTLAADTSRGNRPGFSAAARPDEGRDLYETFVAEMKALGIETQTGRYGADMAVSLINDGPVTISMEI